jgi:DNA mismatch repair protein MutS2
MKGRWVNMRYKRKKLRQDVKEFQLKATISQEEIIESQLRSLQKEKNLDAIKELALQKRKEREQLLHDIENIEKETNHTKNNKILKKAVEAGDFVRLKTSGTLGTVEEIMKDSAKVVMGGLTVLVPLTQLQPERQPQDLRRTKNIFTDILTNVSKVKDKIDIRGLRVDEALTQLQEFVDHALIAGKINLEILHGKGDGTLKRIVRQKLKEYNIPMEITHPAPDAGGDGITLVSIK